MDGLHVYVYFGYDDSIDDSDLYSKHRSVATQDGYYGKVLEKGEQTIDNYYGSIKRQKVQELSGYYNK